MRDRDRPIVNLWFSPLDVLVREILESDDASAPSRLLSIENGKVYLRIPVDLVRQALARKQAQQGNATGKQAKQENAARPPKKGKAAVTFRVPVFRIAGRLEDLLKKK